MRLTDQTPSHAFLNPPWPSLGPSHSFFHSISGLQKMISTSLAEWSDVGSAKKPAPRRMSHMTWMSRPQFRGSWKTKMAWNLTLERSLCVCCGGINEARGQGDLFCAYVRFPFPYSEIVKRVYSGQLSTWLAVHRTDRRTRGSMRGYRESYKPSGIRS